MLITSLITTVLETVLNQQLYRSSALQTARYRLLGKTLKIELQELPTPLVLIFNEHQLQVLGEWSGMVDCTVNTRVEVLPELRKTEHLTACIRDGRLNVTGDMQVIRQFLVLLELAEWDLAEWLAPYTGDIIAETVGGFLSKGLQFFKRSATLSLNTFGEVITQEWQLAPSQEEMAYFTAQNDMLTQRTEQLVERFAVMDKRS